MNKFFKKVFKRNSLTKNLLISIVILIEVVMLIMVTTYAWVETVSSVKLINPVDGSVTTYKVYTTATIGETDNTIDLGEYFKKSGDMHLAPASSANGLDLFFPKTYGKTNGTTGTASVMGKYRKSTSSDKNTAYLSVALKVQLDPSVYSSVDFFFDDDDVNFGSAYLNENVRVSVTEKTVGSSDSPITRIYANTASNDPVVCNANGDSGPTHVEAFEDHTSDAEGDGAPLFTITKNQNSSQVKIIIINIWLQKSSVDDNENDVDDDMETALSQAVDISDLCIKSSLTPRRVTLIPGTSWEAPSGSTWHYYAWCYTRITGQGDVGSKLFELELDPDTGYYTFDYVGSFNTMNFIVAESDVGNTGDISWPSGIKKQSVDTSVPDSPVDPFCFITSYAGGDSSRSTVEWEIPATVKLGIVAGQSGWGTVREMYNDKLYKSGNTYNVHSTASGSTSMLYSIGYDDTRIASAYKKVSIYAVPTPNSSNPDYPHYAFEGWYSDINGTTPVSGLTTAEAEVNSPNMGSQITYYAKFKEVRTIKLYQYVDGVNATGAGTVSVNQKTPADALLISDLVDYNTSGSIALAAAAKPGYTLQGIFTQPSGGSRIDTTTAGSAATVPDNDKEFYARFKTNYYDVTAHALYSTDNGATYTAGSTGGTVKVDTESAGATSVKSIKYLTSATLTATIDSDYVFEGWYDGDSLSATRLSTNPEYTCTVSSPQDVDVYARFRLNKFNVTANATYSSDGTNYNNGSTGGTVKVGNSSAGATSTARVSYNSTVQLVASADPDYGFVGWYTSGGSLLSTSSTYTYTLSTYGDVNVSARFRLTKFNVIAKAAYSADGTTYYEGATGGKVRAGSSGSYSASSTARVTYNNNITLYAQADPDYGFVGWYSSSGSQLSTSLSYSYKLSTYSDVTVYARFRLTKFNVTANAMYSSNGIDYSAGNTGGTVKAGDSTAGATSAAAVTYNDTVQLVASAKSGYDFVGWYDADSTELSTSATYTYTLADYENVDVYARFRENTFTVTAYSYYRTSTSGSYSSGGTGGEVKVYGGTQGATSSGSAQYNCSINLRAYPAAGYVFDGWYASTSDSDPITSTNNASLSESYDYTLSAYSNAGVYARFTKGDIYLTGWINGAAVIDNRADFKFEHGDNADEYELTYTFTGNQGGYQYVTFQDTSLSGNNVYHPTEHESGSGISADSDETDTSPNDDPKWKINATSHDTVTFTWNNKTKTPTWVVTKRYYIDATACSWVTNDSCQIAYKYGNESYQYATIIDSTEKRKVYIEIPDSVTSFTICRKNSSGEYNAKTISTDQPKNKYTTPATFDGTGSWGTQS